MRLLQQLALILFSVATGANKLSREDFRRQKDLDAARKAGTAPAAVDAEGKSINPHIPEYITRAPWYADTGAPSLAHQRYQPKEKTGLDDWYDRGAKAGPAAKKYRKGACENCGSMTHKRQDCVERPRKRGAKFTGKDIQADDVAQDVGRDYDAKRDRWNGYDSSSYRTIMEEYEATEAARQKIREEEIDAQTSTDLAAVKKVAKQKKEDDEDFGSSDEDEVDEDKYADAADQVGQKLDTKTRITVRNLRIREDTAKYLMNLDPDSAYYDPKTRSMRDAPEAGVRPEDLKFAGDNFLRYSGEATNMQKLQLFAWQSSQRGNNVHMQANPTAGELLHREFQEKKEVLKDSSKVSILAKYGGEEHLERMPKELLNGQTEHYVEYSRSGKVIKGMEKAKARSKYVEDEYDNNHTAIWGSFYDRDGGRWGYACCHSTTPGSYCTGEAGKSAAASSSAAALLASSSQPFSSNKEPEKTLVEEHAEASTSRPNGKSKELPNYAKRVDVNEEVAIDQAALKKALDEEKKRKKMGDDEAWQNTKKSKTDVTQEELEAYRLSRSTYEDPMANYQDTEE
ncbi:putative mRNA processing-related protein [Kockovaella imperatae]|uniref:Pre-mRNA-splicing factor SLU7 n=1 Tax=Kockovaella imperatae TaxID=4999 RepID=A0A1Y1UPW3_9TREE|nr:putative mRNA processing-related protein [Kockovaella imperatae]ORX40071.1 putative mRNA processing-related protein [Kockovaella imperatae]